MRNPEYQKVYKPEDIDPKWLGNIRMSDVTNVYLCPSVLVTTPQRMVPLSARVFRTRFVLYRGKLCDENFLDIGEELPGIYERPKPVVLAELWNEEQDDFIKKGYVFLLREEFEEDMISCVHFRMAMGKFPLTM